MHIVTAEGACHAEMHMLTKMKPPACPRPVSPLRNPQAQRREVVPGNIQHQSDAFTAQALKRSSCWSHTDVCWASIYLFALGMR